MAVHFNTYTKAPNYSKSKKKAPARPKTKTEIKKEELRQKRIRQHYAGRLEVTNELKEEMRGKHIPETVEEGIKSGRVSAQEIIELYTDATGEVPGPRMRKYIVANTLAKALDTGKTEGSQSYTPEVANIIIERMIDGESLQSICKDKHMPNISRFLWWVQQNPDLKEQYNLAMQVRAELWALKLPEIASRARMGVKIKHCANGEVEIATEDMINRSRLEADVLKFMLSKILPKTYGPTLADNSQADDSNTVRVVVSGGLPDKPLAEPQYHPQPNQDSTNSSESSHPSGEQVVMVSGGLPKSLIGASPFEGPIGDPFADCPVEPEGE